MLYMKCTSVENSGLIPDSYSIHENLISTINKVPCQFSCLGHVSHECG